MGDEEFDKLMSFFQLSAEERLSRFSEVLSSTVAFFETFREVMQKGSTDEKSDMLRKALELQKVMQSETEEMCDTTGITEEDLKAFALDPSNFSKEQWSEMQATQNELDKQVEAISDAVKFSPSTSPQEPESAQKPKPKRRRAPHEKWTKS